MVQDSDSADGKSSVTLAGTVEKIIKPPHPSLSEKAQINIEGGDDLYRGGANRIFDSISSYD